MTFFFQFGAKFECLFHEHDFLFLLKIVLFDFNQIIHERRKYFPL